MNLKNQIINFLKSLDIDDVGFADTKLYKKVETGFIIEEILPSAKTVIVYLSLMKKLEEKFGKWYIVSLINFQSQTNKKLIDFLNKSRYEAIGIQDNEYDRKTLVGKLSFRQLAVLAGLGSVGKNSMLKNSMLKNSMLIHKKFGPRVVLGVILTDAEIPPDKPFENNLCINCKTCLEMCPVKAISENNFDRWKCKNRRKILGKGCGVLSANLCPIGERK